MYYFSEEYIFFHKLYMKNINTCIENDESEVRDEIKRKLNSGCF